VPAVAVDHRPFGKDRAAFEAALAEALAPFRADILCLAGFMRVLTGRFVGRWRGGC
jgi:phosphoribosylglycinamide formyltransferase-1